MDGLKQPWEDAPRRPAPLLAWIAALAVFAVVWFVALVGFTALVILSEPTRDRWLAAASLFVLIVGTGLAGGLAVSVFQKIRRRADRRAFEASRGEVFTGDWRSGDGNG